MAVASPARRNSAGQAREAIAAVAPTPARDPELDLHLAWGCAPAGDGVAADADGWSYSFGAKHTPLPATTRDVAFGGIAATSFSSAQLPGRALAPLGAPMSTVDSTDEGSQRIAPGAIATVMTENDLLHGFVAAAERDLQPLLRRAYDDLYIDDANRLKALGALLAKAWTHGAAAGRGNEILAEAVDSDVEIDDSALAAALADKVRPLVSVNDVLSRIAARAAATRGATRGSATRDEIASQISVPADEVSRKGGDPDGPLGRAIELAYVEPDPRYKGYWRLTAAGQVQLRT